MFRRVTTCLFLCLIATVDMNKSVERYDFYGVKLYKVGIFIPYKSHLSTDFVHIWNLHRSVVGVTQRVKLTTQFENSKHLFYANFLPFFRSVTFIIII